MFRRVGHLLGCLIASSCGLLVSAPVQARVIGRIVHVGYPTSYGHVVRAGSWVPVVVELRLEGQSSFEGALRVEQPDRDGDLAGDQVRVQLRGEGTAPRRYVLYCVAGSRPGGDTSFSVDLLDGDGDAIQIWSESDGALGQRLELGQQPEVLVRDEYLILELGAGPKGRIGDLADLETREKYDRPIRVAHLAPDALPDLWLGLEMVDCIVWEQADATKLTSAQLDALVAWVRQGGQLLIAAAKTADTIAGSNQLAPILPVKIGRVKSLDHLPQLRRMLGATQGTDEDDDEWEYFPKPISVALCETATGAQEVVREEDPETTIIARRAVGRGQVVFVAAQLGDLLASEEVQPVRFFNRALRLRTTRWIEEPPRQGLFGYLENTVAFRRSTGLYLLAAILFSIAYVGVATFGSWWFLNGRGWTRHAWSVFAVVAAAAAALSVVSVQSMRGMGRTLHQLSIVDATVGDSAATATAYFGLKTGTYSLVDVWLPSDYAQVTEPRRTDCFLKPLPRGGNIFAASSGYADPARYRFVPASAVIEDVSIRATLKQFEGRWSGQLRRTVDANITLVWATGEKGRQVPKIGEGSKITNRLGHALSNCYLIQSWRNAFTPNGVQATLRDDWILVHPVGTIADGEQIDVTERIYTDWATGAPLDLDEWSGRILGEYHKEWARDFRDTLSAFGGGSEVVKVRLEQYQDALLMLTTLGAHDPMNLADKGLRPAGFDFSRHPCRQLDRCDELTTAKLLLIGFAEDQGPVTLCVRTGSRPFEPLRPEQAYTMYRFSIPVTPVTEE